MVADFSDARAAATYLASRIGSDAVDAILLVANLAEELPFIKPVLGTLKAIHERVEDVKGNREELKALEQRCTYITACVVVKSSQNSSSAMNVAPLKECVEAVNAVVLRCSRQGWCRRCLKVSSDKDEIAGLKERLRDLEADVSLVKMVMVEEKMVTVEEKVDDTKAIVVSLCL